MLFNACVVKKCRAKISNYFNVLSDYLIYTKALFELPWVCMLWAVGTVKM